MKGIILTNINLLSKKVKKSACFKWTYELSGNDYRADALSKSYLTVWKFEIDKTILTCLNIEYSSELNYF